MKVAFSWKKMLFWIAHFSVLQLSEATTLSLPERIQICPGATAQHSCTSSTSVNWNFYCPGQLMTRNPQFSRTVDVTENTSFLGHVECRNGDSQIALLNIALTYESLGGDLGVSNISISVVVTNYSIYGIRSLTLDCNDDTQNYRYIDLIGFPPTPVNMTHQFEQSCNETHVPTSLSWLLPPEDEVEGGESRKEDSLIVQYYIFMVEEADENMTLLTTTNTNITVLLQYNSSYNVITWASRCDSRLNSSMTSIELDVPSYQMPSYSGLMVFRVSPSMLSYQCMEGLVPEGTVTSVCGRDGTWLPPPNQYNCTPPENETTTPTTTGGNLTVLIFAGGVAGVVLLSVVAVTAITLICIKISKAKSEGHGPEVPVFEEIRTVQSKPGEIALKENVAYGTSKRL